MSNVYVVFAGSTVENSIVIGVSSNWRTANSWVERYNENNRHSVAFIETFLDGQCEIAF